MWWTLFKNGIKIKERTFLISYTELVCHFPEITYKELLSLKEKSMLFSNTLHKNPLEVFYFKKRKDVEIWNICYSELKIGHNSKYLIFYVTV